MGPGKTQRLRGVDLGCENICITNEKVVRRKKGWETLVCTVIIEYTSLWICSVHSTVNER